MTPPAPRCIHCHERIAIQPTSLDAICARCAPLLAEGIVVRGRTFVRRSVDGETAAWVQIDRRTTPRREPLVAAEHANVECSACHSVVEVPMAGLGERVRLLTPPFTALCEGCAKPIADGRAAIGPGGVLLHRAGQIFAHSDDARSRALQRKLDRLVYAS